MSSARLALDLDTYQRRQETGRRNNLKRRRFGRWHHSDSLRLRVEHGVRFPELDQPFYKLGAGTKGSDGSSGPGAPHGERERPPAPSLTSNRARQTPRLRTTGEPRRSTA